MDSQSKLALIGEIPKPKLFTEAELRVCKRINDALYETIRRSTRSRKAIELDCGISSSHMSRILEGSRTMPDKKRGKFFEACGNFFALQWEAYHYGLRVERRDITAEEKVEALEQRLAELEARQA